MDEFRLIRQLLRCAGNSVAGMRIGPGDDAAVFRPPPETDLVVTTDTQIARVHFEWDWLAPSDVGYRAVMACHSDLAAMGARPWAAFSSLAIPAGMPTPRVAAVQRGLHRALIQLDAALGGGNVAGAAGGFSITLAAIGLIEAGCAVTRTGASPGDTIWCSGHPGCAALGRHELTDGRRRSAAAMSFRRPVARIALGRSLRRRRLVSAMIDISDGLGGDLAHLLSGGIGAVLDRDALLPDPSFARRCQRIRQDPLTLVVAGGEDYELLFTVPRDVDPSRVRAAGRDAKVPVRRIGEIARARGIRLVGGNMPEGRLDAVGFRHDVGSPGRRRPR